MDNRNWNEIVEETIVLHDGENEVEFEILATFGVDDKDYAFLESVEDGEQVILEIVQEGDDMVFAPIESDKEFEEIAKAFEELMDEEANEREN